MKQYLDMLQHVLDNGIEKPDRTGTGTLSVFGYQARYDISERFPLVTTKKIHLKSIIHELLWFLQGSTNIQYLKDNGVKIWDEWADKNGDLGPVYGQQWRRWNGVERRHYLPPSIIEIDQIANVIESIKSNPHGRRHIISAWNVNDIDKMALPPCHLLFQFYVNNKKLSCQLYQRSADLFLGVPFNIASYSLLTMMVAQVCKLQPGEFIHTVGDLHLYNTHLDQARLQLTRNPLSLPTMAISRCVKSIDKFTYDDFSLGNYQSHPPIGAPISV